MRFHRARVVNGHLLSEPRLDPPEDPPELDEYWDPESEFDDFDDFDYRDPEHDRDCDYWERCL